MKIEKAEPSLLLYQVFPSASHVPCEGEGDRCGASLHRALPSRCELRHWANMTQILKRTMEVAVITCHSSKLFWLPSRLSGWQGGGENKSYNCVKHNKFNMRPSIDLTRIDRTPIKRKALPFTRYSNISCFCCFRHTGISWEKAVLPLKDLRYLLKISLIILKVAWR